jgi:predicted acylesterase/phospholipase RssA
MTAGRTFEFDEIFQEEVQLINARRRKVGRTDLVTLTPTEPNSMPSSQARPRNSSPESNARSQEDTHPQPEPVLRPTADSKVVGLALSGGGIRAASFCLGVLQALDKADVLKSIDYLSTVSGGGYIGSSLSAAMTQSKGEFLFASSLTQDEPYSVQHIRDHSNYLFPSGIIDLFCNIVIYLRGLLANALLILPWLLLAAAITIFFKPTRGSLNVTPHFGVTLIVLGAFACLLLAWGLWRSLEISGWGAEIGSRWTLLCAAILLVPLVAIFWELQPLVLEGVFRSASNKTGLLASFVGSLKGFAAVLAPFSAAVALVGRYIGPLLKEGAEKPGITAAALRVAGKAVVYVAGATIPFLLWMAYLYLCFAGIKDPFCSAPYHAPDLISHFSQEWFGPGAPIGWFYLITACLLFRESLLLSPNANSLHRLYRDRLSKAFLFHPKNITPIEGWFPGWCLIWIKGIINQIKACLVARSHVALASGPVKASVKYENCELAPFDRFKLSNISCAHTPYHLINTALNIQGSKYANRRGRNADFFIFSPKFIGSHATKYARTEEFEREVDELDLATAMAISGAAASSNMGSNSIKPLMPTLAMLNIRLGYWLANPGQLARSRKCSSIFDQFYFLQEMFGLMREDSETVYLTDGGHIENLGIYELLRRRCRLIIAVDAEADPKMSFCSFIALQRYARIDLDVSISLPWAAIRDRTLAASEEIAKTGGVPSHTAPNGPHCAIGEIIYPQDQKGILLYVKSSISGDENDYIVDYKRRFASFPHETTADQLFSEEQFEAYRALGFHAVNELFQGSDYVGMRPEPARWQGVALDDPLVKAVKHLLKLRLVSQTFDNPQA